MINNGKKIIVAHPAKQHSYRIASALKGNGSLFKYITTVYDKKYSFTSLAKKNLSGDNLKRANTRSCEILDDNDVIQYCEIRGLFMLILYRFNKKLYRVVEDNVRKDFGIRVAKYGIKENVDAIITYDTQSLYTGKYIKERNSKIKLIMDVSAANLNYMKNIYERDMQINPNFADMLYNERSYLWNTSYMNNINDEFKYIDYFLVPSEFVKKSLVYNGIDESQIYICPYGANFNIKQLKDENPIEQLNNPIEIVFIGTVAALKGIGYLLEAVDHFNKEDVVLKIIGDFDKNEKALQPYFNKYIFYGRVTHDDVYNICKTADIFVLPSLGEGMSLAAIEALSMGIPCIVSDHTGINDFIVNEYNGFVVPIENKTEIINKINWLIENKNKLPQMRKNSIETAKKLTWKNYEKNIIKILNEIIDN